MTACSTLPDKSPWEPQPTKARHTSYYHIREDNSCWQPRLDPLYFRSDVRSSRTIGREDDTHGGKVREVHFGVPIEYDLIIIDCHPAGSLFTKTSLRYSDDVLIPVLADSSYAIRGIGLMMNFINAKKAGGKKI